MSTSQPGAQQFEVGVQTHAYTYLTDGSRVGEWTIPFTTPSGIKSEVIVPDSQYNAQIIGAAIAHQVKAIEEVQALTEAHAPTEAPVSGG